MRLAATTLNNLVFVLLGLSVVALVVSLGFASSHLPGAQAAGIGPGTGPSGGPGAPTLTCGSAGLPACASVNVWIPLKSTASADLIAVAKQSALFNENRIGNGDHTADVSRLGAPLYVQAIQPSGARNGAYVFPDYFVLPILSANGDTTDAAELELNSAHTAIHVIAIVTYTQRRPHGAITQRTADQAAAIIRTEHHIAPSVGKQAQLVYFPGDAQLQQKGEVHWTGGGEYPADPIWRVAGADGQDHFVGVDGHAYVTNQLPMLQS